MAGFGVISVVKANPIHVGMIATRLRESDRREVIALHGSDVRRAIRRCYHMSAICRAAFIGGDIAALWGMTGTMLSDESYGWLLTTPVIERAPIAFFKEVRRQLGEFMETRRVIRSCVAADYDKATRFFQRLGFAAATPKPDGPNGVLFRELVIRSD